jgi:hypothetical protein
VRPEHLRLTGDGELPAVVTVIEALGAERHIVCRVAGDGSGQGGPGQGGPGQGGPGQMVIARQSCDDPAPSVGEAVRLSTSIEHLHAFRPDTGRRVEARS